MYIDHIRLLHITAKSIITHYYLDHYCILILIITHYGNGEIGNNESGFIITYYYQIIIRNNEFIITYYYVCNNT